MEKRHQQESKNHGLYIAFLTPSSKVDSAPQRKVRFPLEFDALDIVTDELKEKLTPINTRLKEIEKERAERRKVRRRMKVAAAAGPSKDKDTEMADANAPAPATDNAEGSADAAGKGKEILAGELGDERGDREKRAKEL